MISALISAANYGLQLAVAIFQRRNQPDMLASAHAAQLAKIQAKVTADIATQNTQQVEDDLAGQ